MSYKAPATAGRHFIAGLAPDGKYVVTAASEEGVCRIAFVPGGEKKASKAGTMMLSLAACALQ
jgi:hypothetical protein